LRASSLFASTRVVSTATRPILGGLADLRTIGRSTPVTRLLGPWFYLRI
jgi:hypothetical protein